MSFGHALRFTAADDFAWNLVASLLQETKVVVDS